MVHKHHIITEYRHEAPFWRLTEAFRRPGPCGPRLLDSALGGGRLGRWSYIAPGSAQWFEAWRNPDGTATVRTEAPGSGHYYENVDPFDYLARWWRTWQLPTEVRRAHPAPFVHGAVGWIGFEAGHCLERWPDTGFDDLGLPDIYFEVHPYYLVHDHESGRTWLSAVGLGLDPERAELMARQLKICGLDQLAAWTPEPDPAGAAPRGGPDGLPPPRVPREAYLAKIRSVQDDIRDGRVFECCLTHRFEQPLSGDPWTLYAVLRRDNPAPFAAYLAYRDTTVICSSPERFLRLDPDGALETRPIKGTRPRGADPAADARLREELAESAKDRAENVMIVDLARNDLGRVCETGSVDVTELCEVEGYATVWQLVSTVRAIRACFPGGSMTGAPKIEAMTMIDELEPQVRGVYAGAIGWLGCDGALDLNMVIRTIVAADGRATYGTGGAVTADSDPETEWVESLDKVRALARAVAAVNDSRT